MTTFAHAALWCSVGAAGMLAALVLSGVALHAIGLRLVRKRRSAYACDRCEARRPART